ncbi:MAG: HlyD family secretion protein, partial [Bacteroidota bacterium]
PNWQQYLDSFDPEAKIKPLPGAVSEQEKYFVSAKNLYNLFYTIQAAEIRLDKYVIHAPFSGTVLEAAIDEGTLVRTGQRIGIFASARSFELEAAMNLKDLKFIRKGDAVTLYSPDIKGEWKGQVVRISDRLDPNTQTVRVFVKVTGENLKEGMYLTAEVDGTSVEKVVKLPRKLLVGNESVYIIEDSTLKLHTITPIKFSTNEVIIKGVPDNSLLLDEVISGAFEGMKVSPY